MTKVACVGVNCTQSVLCRLHQSNSPQATQADMRLCRPGTDDAFEPVNRSLPVGTWEGEVPHFRNNASIFWLAAI